MCGDHPTVRELIDYDQFCGSPPASTAATPGARRGAEITVAGAEREAVAGAPVYLLDVREPNEYQIAASPARP